MNFLGIIPARYGSTRFPGKPLVDIHGKPMIQHVYERASEAFDEVYVATDDNRIYKAINDFGGKAVMTSDKHQSGTDRCVEAVEHIEDITGKVFDVVINIQGDEPYVSVEQLELLVGCFSNDKTQIATLIKPAQSLDEIFNPNKPKVITNTQGEAIYFSRHPIPFVRNETDYDNWQTSHQYYNHIGLYAYKTSILKELAKLPISSLEKAECLEQLRWIENGYHIQTAITTEDTISIDTPEDLERLLKS